MGRKIVHAKVQGTVQRVMFRQTVIRAMIKRDIVGGATNLRENRDQVEMTLDGDENVINEFLATLQATKPLNDWGAQVNKLTIMSTGREVNAHQVTTSNVDNRDWNPNVKFYI
ncbi:hypothetical protein THRCLA_20223 [Thraustotheca clavata]|uniref:acylphosphatase n=1 Tax=Thraustotheca clavata TaxID=74557 RepID=A0A1W0A9U1_9STRA|nr:hypothetical protein THRCLA_20223 [Thraustotheca clavata]